MRPLSAEFASAMTLPRLIHIVFAYVLFVWMSWLLLIPDPYATSRALRSVQALDLHGFLIHGTAYFVVTLALLSTARCDGGPVSVILTTMLIHAGATECLQAWVPGRCSELLDLSANLLGVSLAWSVFLLLRPVPDTAETSGLPILGVDRLRIRSDN